MSNGRAIRYAIYTRQSVARPADFSSCEAQFSKCQLFIDQQKNENLGWVGVHFNDEGESGGTLDRPAMTRLRELVQTRGVDRIYVAALDRLARRAYVMIALLEEFEKAGVLVHLPQEFNPPDGAHARLVRNLLGMFAEFERDMIAARIAETRAYLKQHGRRIAGPAPFGYAPDPATKQLVVIAKEARRVRLIFQRAADGQTPSEIASRINHLKWQTKTWISRRSNRQRGGGKWTARQVIDLLRNPVYIGRHRDPKGSRPGCHAPIVSEVLFGKVQELLNDRRTVSNPTRRRMNFPLRGRIVCPKCGRHLNPQISSKARGKHVRLQHRYYCCRSHAGGRAPCKGVRYPAHEVEQFVRSLMGDPATWRQILPSESVHLAESSARTWMALGHPLQNDLMPQIVESVTFKKKNTAMQIAISPRCVEIVSHKIKGI